MILGHSLMQSQEVSEDAPFHFIEPNELLIDFNFYQLRFNKNHVPYYYKNGVNVKGYLVIAEKSSHNKVIGKKQAKEQLKKLLVLKKNNKVIPVDILFHEYIPKETDPIKYINSYSFMIPIKNLTEGEYKLFLNYSIENKKVRYNDTLNGNDNYVSFIIKNANTAIEKEELLVDLAEAKDGRIKEKFITKLLSENKIVTKNSIHSLMNMMFELRIQEKNQVEAMAWFLCLHRISTVDEKLTDEQIAKLEYFVRLVINNRLSWEVLLKNQREIDVKAKDIFKKYFAGLIYKYNEGLIDLKTLSHQQEEWQRNEEPNETDVPDSEKSSPEF